MKAILSKLRFKAIKRPIHYHLLMLKSKTQRLPEVQVKLPNPIRVTKDTVEYNASAFTVRPHDRIQDLLQQLTGVHIDGSGNVTSLGESMTKLRVNGKNFFTNNLKEFLNQLLVGIISKL